MRKCRGSTQVKTRGGGSQRTVRELCAGGTGSSHDAWRRIAEERQVVVCGWHEKRDEQRRGLLSERPKGQRRGLLSERPLVCGPSRSHGGPSEGDPGAAR